MLLQIGLKMLSALLVVGSFFSMAQASAALIPGAAPVLLPGSTFAAEPDLGGAIIQDSLIPFRIFNAAGALLFEGTLQDRVVRSTDTGLLHFSYRIRDTKPGLNGIIKSVWTRAFNASPRILADWRPDGLGTVNPVRAWRSPGDGQLIRFDFSLINNVLVGGRESRFFYMKTMSKNFVPASGQTRIELSTGNAVVLKTAAPL